MTGKHTACPECGEPSTHDRICGLCETEDAVWRDLTKRITTHQRNENLAVWVIPSTGQFSFDQQDERYCTKMTHNNQCPDKGLEHQNALTALAHLLVVHEGRSPEDAKTIAAAMARYGVADQGVQQAVPMTPVQRQVAREKAMKEQKTAVSWWDFSLGIAAAEAHHGITAQDAQEGV